MKDLAIMRKSLRRTHSRYLIPLFIGLILLLACIAISFLIIKRVKKSYKLNLQAIQEQIEAEKVYVYQAKKDIKAGDVITKKDLNYIKVNSSQSKKYYMREEHIGMVSRINIRKGSYILEDMIVDNLLNGNIREIMYNILFINSNLKHNDVVDVRILFPNGEDYIILSKKSVKHEDTKRGDLFLWLEEKELLDMAGAVVDTYMYPGSKIYTTRYLEPSIQDESITNYIPNLSTLNLIKNSENILKDNIELYTILSNPKEYQKNQAYRKELEYRLKEFYLQTELKFNEPINGVGGSDTVFEIDIEIPKEID